MENEKALQALQEMEFELSKCKFTKPKHISFQVKAQSIRDLIMSFPVKKEEVTTRK